jgi:hypothetical protein
MSIGLPHVGCDAKLGQKGVFLDLRFGIADVVVVETDLTDGDASRVGDEGTQPAEGFRRG